MTRLDGPMAGVGITIVHCLLAVGQPANPPVDASCGSHCLYVSLKALDFDVPPIDQLEARLGPPTAEGYSLARLGEAAQAFGAHTLGVQTNVENLQRRSGRFACIARFPNGHFVNLGGVDEHGRMAVIDPPRSFAVPIDVIAAQWDGTALLISISPLLPEEDLPRPSDFRPVWAGVYACGGAALTLWLVGRIRRWRRASSMR